MTASTRPLLEILVCPACRGALAVDEAASTSWPARPAASPTPSATTSRCCWSTRPVAAGGLSGRVATRSTTPASTTRRRWPAPTPRCAALAEAGARVRREAGEAAEASPRRSPRPPATPPARRGRGRPRLPAAAGGAGAVVPGAVRRLARPGAARLGRRARPRRGARPRRRDSGAASAVAEAVRRGCRVVVACPAELAGRRARRGPRQHPAADARPATRWPRPWSMLAAPRPARPRPATPTPRRSPRPSTTWRSPARRTATSPEPRQDAGHRARRRHPARLGRLGARRPGRPPGGRGAAPGQRPAGPGRRRGAPAAGDGGRAGHRPVRRPVRRRRTAAARPALLVLDDGSTGPVVSRDQRAGWSTAAAERTGPGRRRSPSAAGPVARYAALLATGTLRRRLPRRRPRPATQPSRRSASTDPARIARMVDRRRDQGGRRGAAGQPGIAVMKFAAFALTGASSMLAEAIHSVADSGNQGLLLLGGKRSQGGRPRSTLSASAGIATSTPSSSRSCCSASAACSRSTRRYHKAHELHAGEADDSLRTAGGGSRSSCWSVRS